MRKTAREDSCLAQTTLVRVGSQDDIKRQARYFVDSPVSFTIFDTVPDAVMVLNHQRQIVFANLALVEFAGKGTRSELHGVRPGDVFGCTHACETPGGCGTTEFCGVCGAAEVIKNSLDGIIDMRECRIVCEKEGGAYDFRVWGSPFTVFGEPFTILTVRDIGSEKRREALEHVFLHDVKNLVCGLQGLTEIAVEGSPEEKAECQVKEQMSRVTEQLLKEIESHALLKSAEIETVALNPEAISPADLLEELSTFYRFQELSDDRVLVVDAQNAPKQFHSDRALLSRVLGNMIKNALEASAPGAVIKIGCRLQHDEVVFWVHNPQPMPREVQLQVFQRSFSTKGSGRGLGTYGMRLLSEKYLKGSVEFVSGPKEGTTFTATYPLHLDVKLH